MPRPTSEVTRDILNQFFIQYQIWERIKDNRLTSRVVAFAPSKTWPNATSFMIKHYLPGGKHIATTHCIKSNETGKVLHWDAKDIVIDGVCYWRA